MSPARSEVITIFRNRLVEGAESAYADLAPHIASLASNMPGLVDFKTFTAPDGERVTIVTFSDQETHNAWRDHPEHVAARARGVAEFYSTYSIQVGTVSYSHHFTKETT
jgi:heme-degrading monooxygenase HmoA